MLNRDTIKYLAILAMLLNHIANLFLTPGTLLCEIFLDIGYFTAITMCYFLVEGFHFTHSKRKYGQRLLLFAILSQVPFMLCFSHTDRKHAADSVSLLSDPCLHGAPSLCFRQMPD